MVELMSKVLSILYDDMLPIPLLFYLSSFGNDAIESNFSRYMIMRKRINTLYTVFLLFVGVALFWSCDDDDSFTTSTSNLLTFSKDTIRLDTIFSTVPTATKTFWVYNNSGDGIRCTTVRLEKGNQTGFRVNVDGEYLGQTSGYQVHDVEIRNKDSIRVFVELTSVKTLRDEPTLVEDDLIFTLESGVEQKVNLNAYSWDVDIYNNVVVSRDSTIASTKPILIRGGLKVEENATLTIAAGTTLYFANNAGVDVYGRLITAGTPEANVVLRGDRIDRMFDYLPYDRVPGQWQGIHFYEKSYDNELNYTDIHSTYNGVVCDSADVEKLKLKLYNSQIHNCQGYGLMATNCKLDLYNSQITNTLNDCAAFFGGDVILRHCTVAQFYPFDANRGAALRFTNQYDGKIYPLLHFDVYNSIVTGYADDVIFGGFSDEAVAEYSFHNCLLRTPEDETMAEHLTDVIYEDVEDTITDGEKNFRMIDTDDLKYDFRLVKKSKAVDAGAVLDDGYSVYDRLGIRRDDKPDIGAYEYEATEEDSEENE